MKLYELMEINGDWDGLTVLSISTTQGVISISCINVCDSNITVNGKRLPCLDVKWFSGKEIIAW